MFETSSQISSSTLQSSHSPIVRKQKRKRIPNVRENDTPIIVDSLKEMDDREEGKRVQIENILPEDIISVRGCGNGQKGNLLFRELIYKHKAEYDENIDPDHRREIAIKIINRLKPGRFLKKRNNSDSYYFIMAYDLAIQKTVFAMRDCRATKTKISIPSNPIEGRQSRSGKQKKNLKIHPIEPRSRRITINRDPAFAVVSDDFGDQYEKSTKKPRKKEKCRKKDKTNKYLSRFMTKITKLKKIYDPNNLDVWTSKDKQERVKNQLLNRCKLANDAGIKPRIFFEDLLDLFQTKLL